jgi:hypothetical protein
MQVRFSHKFVKRDEFEAETERVLQDMHACFRSECLQCLDFFLVTNGGYLEEVVYIVVFV